jgi:hypothetical protein
MNAVESGNGISVIDCTPVGVAMNKKLLEINVNGRCIAVVTFVNQTHAMTAYVFATSVKRQACQSIPARYWPGDFQTFYSALAGIISRMSEFEIIRLISGNPSENIMNLLD